MKRIVVEIGGGNRFCGPCNCIMPNDDGYGNWCGIFGTRIKGTILEGMKRCPKCLAAEIKEGTA